MRRLFLQKIFLIASDILAIFITYFVSLEIANLIEGRDIHYFGTHHMVLLKLMNVLVIIILFWVAELYTKRRPTWEELRITYRQILYILLIDFILITFNRDIQSVTYLFFFLYWLLLLVFQPLVRMVVIRILLHYRLWQRRVYVIGTGNNAEAAYYLLKGRRQMGLELRAFITLDNNDRRTLISIDGRDIPLCPFEDLFAKNRSAEVTIALESHELEIHCDKIFRIQRYFFFVSLIPDFNGLSLYGIEVNHFFGKEQLLLRLENNLNRRVNRTIKLLFDLVLIILLLPFILVVMGIICLLIYLEDFGNPFFIQPRVGQNGRIFNCVKFRTMHKNAEKMLAEWEASGDERYCEYINNNFKLKNDPRITRIGRFLRRSSLDELGQLINIIKGEMSLVGPRPLIRREVKDYDDGMFYYGEVRPGITGMWQVSGRSRTSFRDRCRLDTWYIKNWSLWYDVVILLKTIEVVFKRDGAY